MHVPLLALTGGDPLLRPDLFPVVEFASSHSVRTSLTLLPTPSARQRNHRRVEGGRIDAGCLLAAWIVGGTR